MNRIAIDNFLSNAKKARTGIAFMVLFIIAALFRVYRAQDEIREKTEVVGTLQGVHQTQSRFKNCWVYSVLLPDGNVVNITPPNGTPFIKGANVFITHARTVQGHDVYYFKGYAR